MPVIATAGIFFLLYVTGFFVMLTPLPIALTAVRRGFTPAVAAFSLAQAALAAVYLLPTETPLFLPFVSLTGPHPRVDLALFSALTLCYYGGIGLMLARVGRSPLNLEKGMSIVLVAVLAAVGVLLFLFQEKTGVHLVEEYRSNLQVFFDRLVSLQKEAGGSGIVDDELLFLEQSGPFLISRMVQLLPAFLVGMTLGVTALNALFLRKWSGDAALFGGWGDFSLWRLPEGWIWLPIGCGVLFFGSLYGLHSEALQIGLINLLLVIGLICFFQGLAIVIYYLQRKLSPFLRMFAYLTILLFIQMVGAFIVILGLFDFWFDFRKVKK